MDFGALSGNDTIWSDQINANAFNEAIVAANFTDDRTVYVPYNTTFITYPIYVANITNITFQIDGTIKFSKRHNQWPLRKEGTTRDCIFLQDVENITFQGNGTVDGQGYMWWVRELFGANHNKRPILLNIQRGRNIEIKEVRWINSPRFNIWLEDVDSVWVHDFEIWVDIEG